MPLKIYRPKASRVWHYAGTLAGHRLRGTTGTPDKETAQRIASEIESKFWRRGLDKAGEVLTWPKAVALYMSAGKSSEYLVKLTKYWGDAKIADINAGSIRQAGIDIYPHAKNSTRNRQVIVPCQAVINHCADLSLCPPLRMKRFKVDAKIKKPATTEWIDTFIRHATRADIGVLALFMFATGGRISECLSVQWGDIDFKSRTVLIRQTKLGNERRAHLPQGLFIMLANLPRRAKPFNFAGHSSALKAWEATIKRAGIEKLTFHSCRHGFATALLHKGIDPVTIAKLGGWKSAAHVFATYGHAKDDATLTDQIFDNGMANKAKA